ncbi:MAG: hypothetical protein M1826_006583 [Phylliscum demangeonii]|nr:MAG: hypothetical protein M1826_006583 [Phylliscum demangeonii]
MLPPHRLIALALYVSAAYGRPASPSDENKPGDGQASKDGQLLNDPYNPHGLVSSGIPGRRPYLPMPGTFLRTPAEWRRIQNTKYLVSQILTYDGNPISAFQQMPPFVAAEKHCIGKVNNEIQTEATAKEKSTYFAGQDTAALHNPYHLESPNTPNRPPRLPHDQRPAGDQRDLHTYIADENKKEIISKLQQYDGQRPTSWERFIACMESKLYQMVTLDSYLTEQLHPAQMLEMSRDESGCIKFVNSQIDREAFYQDKQAFLPVRTYAPLPPPQHAKQAQQAHTPRNEFSPASIATTWAHRAGHFLTTQSHRLELGARPLQKLVRETHMKMPTAPELRAREVDHAH